MPKLASMTARRLAARFFFISAVIAQLIFIVRGYRDPQKHFAFQPFNEWDIWRAEIVRVTYRGARISIEQPWYGYSWQGLIGGDRGLDQPAPLKPASSGIGSTLAFLQEALHYAADNTPRDLETHFYEATVYYRHNGGPEQIITLRSRSHVPPQEAFR